MPAGLLKPPGISDFEPAAEFSPRRVLFFVGLVSTEHATEAVTRAAILVPSRDWIGAPRLLVMQENPLVAAGGLSMRSQMQFHAIKWAPILILVCLLVSACSSSDRFQSSSTAPSWVQNLNEPPPSREAAGDQAARPRADLNRSFW